MQAWQTAGHGIAWITLMLDDPGEGAATVAGAKIWRDNWGLDSVTVCADPDYSMVPGSSVGTPQLTLVDPRTMRVLDLQEGYSGDYGLLIDLAQQNKN